MKRKTYSLQIRKTLAVLLHLIFLTLTVTSISFMYCIPESEAALAGSWNDSMRTHLSFSSSFSQIWI